MVSAIYCNYTPYSEKERARAILFAGVPVDSFKLVFVFDGVKYYKKSKIKQLNRGKNGRIKETKGGTVKSN